MGKIYRDGIIYAGGGNVKECTQAQYNEWKSNGQLVKGVTYNIIDAPNLNETAKQISYDGTITSVWEKVESKANKAMTLPFEIASGFTVASFSACYVDKLVSGTINISGSFTSGTWVQIGTITDKLPSAMIRVPAVNVSQGSFMGMVRIDTDGKVYLYPVITGSIGAGFTFGYMAS